RGGRVLRRLDPEAVGLVPVSRRVRGLRAAPRSEGGSRFRREPIRLHRAGVQPGRGRPADGRGRRDPAKVPRPSSRSRGPAGGPGGSGLGGATRAAQLPRTRAEIAAGARGGPGDVTPGHALTLRPGSYSIVRLGPRAKIPAWAAGDGLSSVTRTRSEL